MENFYNKFIQKYPQYDRAPIPNDIKKQLTQSELLDLSLRMQNNPQLSAFI